MAALGLIPTGGMAWGSAVACGRRPLLLPHERGRVDSGARARRVPLLDNSCYFTLLRVLALCDSSPENGAVATGCRTVPVFLFAMLGCSRAGAVAWATGLARDATLPPKNKASTCTCSHCFVGVDILPPRHSPRHAGINSIGAFPRRRRRDARQPSRAGDDGEAAAKWPARCSRSSARPSSYCWPPSPPPPPPPCDASSPILLLCGPPQAI